MVRVVRLFRVVGVVRKPTGSKGVKREAYRVKGGQVDAEGVRGGQRASLLVVNAGQPGMICIQ